MSIYTSVLYKLGGDKVSFDYNGTLNTAKGQAIAKRLIEEGKEVHIVTRLHETMGKGVKALAQQLGIPLNHVHFTEGQLKWKTLKRLGIRTHYDNNQNELDKIIENTTGIKGIKV